MVLQVPYCSILSEIFFLFFYSLIRPTTWVNRLDPATWFKGEGRNRNILYQHWAEMAPVFMFRNILLLNQHRPMKCKRYWGTFWMSGLVRPQDRFPVWLFDSGHKFLCYRKTGRRTWTDSSAVPGLHSSVSSYRRVIMCSVIKWSSREG